MSVELTECFISVDVETAGPDPGEYALLSIGACLVADPEQSFYVELKPTTMNSAEEALALTGFSLEALAGSGVSPEEAMQRFEAWLKEVGPADVKPVFVAFNAGFDWMFVNSYFHRYLGRNPFGHAALDMKAFFMGLTGSRWAETAMRHVVRRFESEIHLTHHALQDAKDQALLFQRMLHEAAELRSGASKDAGAEEKQA
jgi:ribonuclease T